MNCNRLARHEIFVTCIEPSVNFKASEEWPANASIIQYVNCTNSIINITVRAINDAGHAGPLSAPFHILLSAEKSVGVIDNPADAKIVLIGGDPSVDLTITSMTTSGTEDVTTDRATDVTIEESDATADVTTYTATDVTTDSDTTVDVTTARTADVTRPTNGTTDATADVTAYNTAATTSGVTTVTTADVIAAIISDVTTDTIADVTTDMTGEKSLGVIANPTDANFVLQD